MERNVYCAPQMLTITLEPVRSILQITPEFSIHSHAPLPNLWRRFFFWALLGWTWRRR